MKLGTLLLCVRLVAAEDGIPLLRRVADVMKSATTLHIDCTIESEFITFDQRSWTRSREVISRDGPQRFRFEVQHPSGSHTVVSDGKTVWIASADTREFMRTTSPMDEAHATGPLGGMARAHMKRAFNQADRFEEQLRKAEAAGTQTIDIAGQRVEAVVVRAQYIPPKAAPAIESWERTFWIDPHRNLVVREESVSRGKLDPSRPFVEAETRHTRVCTTASVNASVDSKLFTFDVPAGYREVDKLDRAFPRPAKQLIGTRAPDLSLTSLDGAPVKLSEQRGKIVLLEFWATWCQPCHTQMPKLASLYDSVREQGVTLIGINDDESPETAAKYVRERAFNWPQWFDGKSKDARAAYKVDAIPTLVLIDREGTIIAYEVGSGEAAESAIREALKKAGVQLQ